MLNVYTLQVAILMIDVTPIYTAISVGFTQPLYEVEEGNLVTVCAETDGELRRTVYLYLTSEDKNAIGKGMEVLRNTCT